MLECILFSFRSRSISDLAILIRFFFYFLNTLSLYLATFITAFFVVPATLVLFPVAELPFLTVFGFYYHYR